MGKPVIMTRQPLIDLDIEAMGIGKWIEPGDVDGWKDAIQFFEDNQGEAIKMGQRARSIVEAGMDSVSFANQLIEIFDNLLTKTIPETGSQILTACK
jgi:glycosyltransferase involved in cell wall biosynthesis